MFLYIKTQFESPFTTLTILPNFTADDFLLSSSNQYCSCLYSACCLHSVSSAQLPAYPSIFFFFSSLLFYVLTATTTTVAAVHLAATTFKLHIQTTPAHGERKYIYMHFTTLPYLKSIYWLNSNMHPTSGLSVSVQIWMVDWLGNRWIHYHFPYISIYLACWWSTIFLTTITTALEVNVVTVTVILRTVMSLVDIYEVSIVFSAFNLSIFSNKQNNSACWFLILIISLKLNLS